MFFCCSTKKKKPAMRPQIEVHTSNQSTNNTMNLSTDRSNNFNEEIKRFIKNKGDKTIDDERQLIKKLVQLSDQTHLINQIWSMKYTDYLQNNGPKPGPIDNKELIQKLKDNVAEEGRDYDCIPELVWNFVVEIYTGGPVVLKPEEQLIQSLRVFPSPSLHSIKDSYTNFKELKSQDLQIVGLRNQKYFCYINSLLQCWMGIGVMNNYIFNLPITESQQYLWSFLTLIQKVQQTQFAHSISASKLIQLLTKTFSGYQMHDSQEVMLFLLEKFKSEMQKKAYIRDQAPSQAQESYIQYCRNNNNFVDELFFGQLTSSIQCKYCNSESNQHDPFYDMSLPVDGKTFMSQTITLNDCLKLFFKDDIIETWSCGQCNKKNNKIKRKTKISHTPNILILHLKRFRQYPQKMKVNEPVTIQQELDISSYCFQDVKDTKYKLIAMILHSGSIDQGHYVAVVNRKDKNQKESFYLFDDEEVQILHQSCLNKIDSVYILFYHKV